MLEVVAVVHVGVLRVGEVGELSDRPHGRSRVNQHRVLEAALLRQRRLAVTIEQLKLDTVDVEWMGQGGRILDLPDLDAAEGHAHVDAPHVHGCVR